MDAFIPGFAHPNQVVGGSMNQMPRQAAAMLNPNVGSTVASPMYAAGNNYAPMPMPGFDGKEAMVPMENIPGNGTINRPRQGQQEGPIGPGATAEDSALLEGPSPVEMAAKGLSSLAGAVAELAPDAEPTRAGMVGEPFRGTNLGSSSAEGIPTGDMSYLTPFFSIASSSITTGPVGSVNASKTVD